MPDRLGILAGGGALPARLVAAERARGGDPFVIALQGQADSETVSGCDHAWLRMGAAGAILDALRAAGVGRVVFAGKVHRPSLAALRPDAWAMKFLVRNGAAGLGDDGLLKALVRALEDQEGFRVIGADEILESLRAPAGPWGRHAPDSQAEVDIARGLAVARGIGALDVGQGAVVQQGLVLAVEAIEGTDAMLARCAGLARPGPGGVLVKVSKPQQERRADLPTIGPATVAAAAAAGLRGIAVEAGGALVVDREATVTAADAAGLFIVGIAADTGT